MTETPSGRSTAAFTWDSVGGGSTPLLVDGTNAYIYGPLLFGGTAPVEQIKLSSSTPTYLSSIQSGVQLASHKAGICSTGRLTLLTGFRPTARVPKARLVPRVRTPIQAASSCLVHRYYDPTTGQFLSVDPALAITGQPYAFTGDDPLNATDPLGLGPGLDPQLWWHRNLPRVRNRSLRSFLNELYRPEDRMSGGTAASIREEARTGKPFEGSFHEVKGYGAVRFLADLLGSGELL